MDVYGPLEARTLRTPCVLIAELLRTAFGTNRHISAESISAEHIGSRQKYRLSTPTIRQENTYRGS